MEKIGQAREGRSRCNFEMFISIKHNHHPELTVAVELSWREERVSVGVLPWQTLGQQEDSLHQHLLVISSSQPEETIIYHH